MHDEGGCALVECSCHEAVEPRFGDGSPLPCADRMDDDDRPEPLATAMLVHAIELENLTGLASLKLSVFARTVDGRTTLVVRVGVLS
jgi:hypothetical protein